LVLVVQQLQVMEATDQILYLRPLQQLVVVEVVIAVQAAPDLTD
jgi:hypothetical protein